MATRLKAGISPYRVPPPIPDRGTAVAIADLRRRVNALESTAGYIGDGSVGTTQVGKIDGTTNITAGTITSTSIATGAITANTIAANAISAYVIAGNSITLASSLVSSSKVLLDNTGIKAYDGLGALQLTISASDGSISASKGTITGAILQTGGSALATSAANKVAMDSQGIKAWDALGNLSVQIDTTGTLVVARGSLTFSSTIPAGTNARMTIDSTGLKAYNASNQNLVTIDAASGLITATGVITAQTGSAIPTATITGYMPGSANRYSNSAFQDGAGNFSITGWTVTNASAATGGTTVPPIYGVLTLKLTATGSVIVNPSTATDNYRRVVPGVGYTFSHYVWPATTARQSAINVNWYNSAGTLLSTSNGAAQTPTLGIWNRITQVFTAPANAAYAQPVHWIGVSAVSGEVFYVEAFQMEEGDRASAYAPRPDEVLVNQINANNIVAGSITATQMSATYFNANGLSAITGNIGTITSGTINSATVQTSSSASSTGGVVLNSTGITGYDSSGAPIWGVSASGLFTTALTAGTGFNIAGGTFKVDSTGALTATSATITGTITTNSLTVTALGSSGISVGGGTFAVTSGGAVTASNATITGAITATSGTISGNLLVSGALQTASSGARTQLDATGLRAFSSTAETARLDHTQGVTLLTTNNSGLPQAINFFSGSITGTKRAQIFSTFLSTQTVLQLGANNPADLGNFSGFQIIRDTGTASANQISAFAANAAGSLMFSLVILDGTGNSDLLQKGNNLSDVTSVLTARNNINLGTGNSPTFAGLTATGNISITGNGNSISVANALSTLNNNTGKVLDVTTNGNDNNVFVANISGLANTTFTHAIVRAVSSFSGGTGYDLFWGGVSGTTVKFRVDGSGNPFATSTITIISDRALKDKVKPLTGALADILKLKPREFIWREHEAVRERVGERAYGLVAQELETVMPHLVSDWRWHDPEYGEGKSIKGYRPADMVPHLVAAIQELHAESTSLNRLAGIASQCDDFASFKNALARVALQDMEASQFSESLPGEEFAPPVPQVYDEETAQQLRATLGGKA